MVIDCANLDEFLGELEYQAARGTVFERTARVRIDRQPEQDEELSYVVLVTATALLGLAPDRPCLLELQLPCGVDDSSRKNPKEATERAEFVRSAVQKLCTQYDLRLGPGKWDLA